MTVKPPPRPADHPDRDMDCQFALEPALHAVLDEARAAGWSEQEIVTAVMELTNAWYFARLANDETEAAIIEASRVKARH